MEARISIHGRNLTDFVHAPPVYLASRAFERVYAKFAMSGLSWHELRGFPDLLQVAPVAFLSLHGEVKCQECGRPSVPPNIEWQLSGSTWSGQHFFAFAVDPTVLFCSAVAREILESTILTGFVFVDPSLILGD